MGEYVGLVASSLSGLWLGFVLELVLALTFWPAVVFEREIDFERDL